MRHGHDSRGCAGNTPGYKSPQCSASLFVVTRVRVTGMVPEFNSTNSNVSWLRLSMTPSEWGVDREFGVTGGPRLDERSTMPALAIASTVAMVLSMPYITVMGSEHMPGSVGFSVTVMGLVCLVTRAVATHECCCT